MTVRLEVNDGVATVTLCRPAVMNALDSAGKRALADIWRRLADDEGVGAVIVTGEGHRAFCAGSDVKEIRATGHMVDTDALLESLPNSGALRLRQPVIAAINGACLGYGVTLAIHCDLRIASETATFAVPEVQHGFISGFTAALLPTIIPRALAMEMLLLGDTFSASWAEQAGLVSRVVPADELAASARTWAARLQRYPSEAVTETKRLALLGLDACRQASTADVSLARDRIAERLNARHNRA